MFENTFQGPGAGTYMDHTLEILLMLLIAFLLGLLLGYIIWYKWRKMNLELQGEYDRLRALHTDLEKEHASLRYKHDVLDKENHDLRAKVRSLEAEIAALKSKLQKCESDLSAAMASGISGKGAVMGAVAAPPVSPDDLKVVEGIGPKIEKLLNDSGIWTFAALTGTTIEVLQKILEDAGPNYRISDPTTWPRQAELAGEGKWDELKDYQDFLSGGKAPT